ncbi:hypothetical protein D0Y65_030781 [Glycine soja]|uniref:Uncharacterized protein n=1 Tax=Glycine soja TaxID=3848 RepID=A0A445I593_GLYSO|nr:hypothetical protein D0Y65_030781 [Glycine soja]RZB81177.1 hypothetical protein D0Y65_030781 [Glycine soja]RZB81178.1 hypothetical protein D0Y65_030781 [Glycine soja]
MVKKIKRKKEEIAEDWCFVCKDGGLLMVCEYRDCLKAYHPRCVAEDDSFLDNECKWTCDSHSCSLCRKPSKFKCFCCPKAVCGKCFSDAEFAIVKGNKGFCTHCSKLAFLIEENADVDSDGEKVDFKDRDTYECLFSEYYEIIKKEEGLNSQHAYQAHKFLKNGKNKCDLDPDEIGEGEDDTGDSEDVSNFIVSDCDDLNDTAGSKSARKKKGMGKLKSMKGKVKDKKEFIGWGSRMLIEFLKYIGKDTSKEFSEHDVTSIIIEYCRENNLFDPKKKRKILCDEQLRSLIGRKSVNKNSIQNLLAPHFAENSEEMDDISSSSEDRDCNEPVNFSRKRKSISCTESQHPNLVSEERQSCFAAIVSSNLKLVYLKRSLVDELSKQPETFDGKVLGSYVRVKSDPYDYLQKNSHLLVQVVGINRSLNNGEINKEIMLQLSNVPKAVPICKISDVDFSEEECQDLYQRMRNGLLKQPTVLELEQKARTLHEDIMKHWIPRKLVLLQNLIDQANEKGWRRQLSEYMDQKLKLETPLEQSRLLNDIPKVIPEIVDNTLSLKASPTKDKLEQNGLSELASGKTCNSAGRHSKHSGFVHCLNNRTDVAGGYWTYVKVRPYRQGSIVKKLHQKLVVCYYRPFPVVKQMGPVAFQLQLHRFIIVIVHPKIIPNNSPFLINNHVLKVEIGKLISDGEGVFPSSFLRELSLPMDQHLGDFCPSEIDCSSTQNLERLVNLGCALQFCWKFRFNWMVPYCLLMLGYI